MKGERELVGLRSAAPKPVSDSPACICKPTSKFSPPPFLRLSPAVPSSAILVQKDANYTASPSEDPSSPSDFCATSGSPSVSPASNAAPVASQLQFRLLCRKYLPADPSTSTCYSRLEFVHLLIYLALLRFVGAAVQTATEAAHYPYIPSAQKELSRLADRAIPGPL